MATAFPIGIETMPAVFPRLTAKQQAEVDHAMEAIAAGRRPLFSSEEARQTVELKLQQAEEAQAEHDDLTPEELAEVERRAAAAEENLRAGRCISAERFFADRGIPYPPR